MACLCSVMAGSCCLTFMMFLCSWRALRSSSRLSSSSHRSSESRSRMIFISSYDTSHSLVSSNTSHTLVSPNTSHTLVSPNTSHTLVSSTTSHTLVSPRNKYDCKQATVCVRPPTIPQKETTIILEIHIWLCVHDTTL